MEFGLNIERLAAQDGLVLDFSHRQTALGGSIEHARSLQVGCLIGFGSGLAVTVESRTGRNLAMREFGITPGSLASLIS